MKKIVFYKANKTMNGNAISFDFNKDKESIFMEVASQKDEKSFDWDKKITMKLNVTDMSKILNSVEARKELQVYHDPNKNEFAQGKVETAKNTTLNIMVFDTGFNFKVGEQGKDNLVVSKSISVSNDEAVVLKVMLKKAIERIYDW